MGLSPAVGHNLDPGGYTINQPSVCMQHSEILLLVVIRTIFSHFDRRTVIRETWAARKNYHGSFVHILFFFDRSEDNKHIQESIERESMVYSDVVQYTAEFSDHTNLTVKTSIAAQWVNEFCPQARFVLVADDNVVVDIFKILPFLREQPQTDDSNCIALCHFRTSVNEMLLSKHETAHASEDQHFCSNEAFVATPSVLDQLYLTLRLKGLNLKQEHMWLSALAREAGVHYSNTSQHFAGARKKPSVLKTFMSMDYATSAVMIGIVSEDFQGKEATIMRHIWRIIQEHHTKVQISNVYNQAQFPLPKTHEIGSVRFMAVVLMCVDFGVVFIIIALIFCKRRRKKCW